MRVHWFFFLICVAACGTGRAQDADPGATVPSESLKQLVRVTYERGLESPETFGQLFHFEDAATRDALLPAFANVFTRLQKLRAPMKDDPDEKPGMSLAFAMLGLPETPPAGLAHADAAVSDDRATLEVDYSDEYHFRKVGSAWKWDAHTQLQLEGDAAVDGLRKYLAVIDAALTSVETQVAARQLSTTADLAGALDRAVCIELMAPHLTDRADAPVPPVHADERRLVSRAGRIATLAVSPDQKTFVTGAASARQPLRVWDTASGKPKRDIGPKGEALCDVLCVRFLPDGKTVAALITSWEAAALFRSARSGAIEKPYELMGSHTTVRLFNVETGDELPALARTEKRPAEYIAISADGRLLAAPGAFGTSVWNLSTRKLLPAFPEAAGATFDPQGRLILIQFASKAVTCDPETGAVISTAATSDARADREVGPVTLSPDGTRLAYATLRGVVVMDAHTGRNIKRLALPTPGGLNRVNAVAFSADGRRVLGCCGLFSMDNAKRGQVELLPTDRTRMVCLWDAASGKVVAKFDAYDKTVSDVAFIDGEKSAIAASTDGTIRVWKLPGK